MNAVVVCQNEKHVTWIKLLSEHLKWQKILSPCQHLSALSL